MHALKFMIAACLFAAVSMPAGADEFSIKLKKESGVDTVETNCGSCHSLDYILMNAPYPTALVWDAEVTKMIKVFGAPIDDKDAATIKAYLAKNYGS